MSASMYRGQLDRKRKQRLEADRRANEYRSKESVKRNEAAKARQAAHKSKSTSTQSSKLREAERKEKDAASAAKTAADWAKKASRYAAEEASLAVKLSRAEQSEALATEKKRQRAQHQADQRVAAQQRVLESRVTDAERGLVEMTRELPAPKQEQLRVLILGASSEGDLRVGREQKRIRAAVESALHRELVELDVRPAATTDDLLDGITKFRPHVVHFSGHSDADLIVFEDEEDGPHAGVIVTAAAFARAVQATDAPPLLVLLNSCNSAAQIDGLVKSVAPFAIGMADSIADADAINYAAQFYAAVANGQSIGSAHASGQAALELAGLDSAELPTLAWADDVDPNAVVLVTPA
ncbi:CHAT domain-containing protein [Aeromicrobium panaciterrae]|uniref:hypothetical protein n=1 Tax=Aeromicrobium panaciterrae TaxID=363861 RepID=UPI0031DF04BD